MKVDHNALRVNQTFIILLLSFAFLVQSPEIVAFVAAVMVTGTLIPSARLFVLVYQYMLKPAGLLQPDIVDDDPAPHRFAMGLGGICTTIAAIALFTGFPILGWAFSWMVVALAALNLFVGFCAGCFVYYQLRKLGARQA